MLELRLLGPPRISASNDQRVETLVRLSKRMALLAYLAAALPRGAHRRDRLLALFWPEADEARARAALNQALYVLRSRLGDRVLVTRGDDEVALDPDALWCDAVAFEAALDDGRAGEALALYRGDLLDGFFVADAPEFERWVEQERSRLRLRASEGAWAIAGARAAAGYAVAAERLARKAAELLPADEAVVRMLMLFLHGLGDRAAAIRAYEAFAWRLTQEYELDPSAQTQALAEAIRRQRPEARTLDAIELPGRRASPLGVRARERIPLGTVAVTVVLVAALMSGVRGWSTREDPAPHPETRFTLSFEGVPAMAAGVEGTTIALSPNGAHLVYLGASGPSSQLFLRPMNRTEARAIPHTRGATQPFFSPDGAWLGFVLGNRIRKVRLAGGPATDVCRVTTSVLGASWGDDGAVVFATPEGLWKVPGNGGEPEALALADTANGEWYRWPALLPGSRAALLTVVSRDGFEIGAVSLTTGAVRRLGLTGTSPHFVDDGFLVFARRDGVLLAAPFDAKALRVTGGGKLVAERVHVGIAGVAKLGISRAGALAFVPASFHDALSIVDRTGHAESVPLGSGSVSAPRFSPDGDRIAASVSSGGPWPDVWVVDRANGTTRRVTFDSGSVGPVAWSGDGERIAFGSKPGGRPSGVEIRWKATDAREPAATLLAAAPGQFPGSFTPDGRALVFQRVDPASRRDIWILNLEGDRSSRPYLRGPADERAASLSPNGRWLAWVSDESGRDEVYVSSFPEPDVPVQVSSGGGGEPRWAPNGRELFYRGAEGMIAVQVVDAPVFRAGPHDLLFDDERFVSSRAGAAYDVHPDGHLFAMIERGDRSGDVLVVLDWLAGLRERGG